MSLLNVKTWVPHEYEHEGHTITYELKRPNRLLARRVQLARYRLLERLAPLIGKTTEETEAIPPAEMGRILRESSEPVLEEAEIKEIFEGNVNNVGGLALDGNEVKTGLELYEWAPMGMVNRIIGQLADMSKVTEPEGKTSASPSTSSAVATDPSGASSGSPAASTEREASPQPSTATADPAAA